MDPKDDLAARLRRPPGPAPDPTALLERFDASLDARRPARRPRLFLALAVLVPTASFALHALYPAPAEPGLSAALRAFGTTLVHSLTQP